MSNITLSMYLQTFDTHSSNNQKCPDIVLQMHTHMNYLPRHFYSSFSFYSLVKWSLEILWGEYVQDFLLIIFCKKCAERTFDSLIDSLMIFKHKKARKYELLSVTPRGIEPLIPAWEASVLTAWPRSLIHFRLRLFCYRHKTIVIIYQAFRKCNPFF